MSARRQQFSNSPTPPLRGGAVRRVLSRSTPVTGRYTLLVRVLLAGPRGYCAGVSRAVEIVDRALEIFSPPIYVKHEIIHNHHVVERLRARGVVFIEDVAEAPDDAVLIFSAHGVPPSDRDA